MDPQIQATLTNLQAELRRQHDEITFLRTLLTTRASAKPKPSLPNPEKFTGHSYKFDTWLPSIRAKLRVDGEAIGGAIAQFYYVYLNLDSQVQAMVLPQLSQAASGTPDYNTILEQLTRVYDNPNKMQEAEDKLFALKQGTDSMPAYIAKFERTLYEARGQDWPDVNKISTFRNGLNSMIRNRLTQQLNLPAEYSEFIRVIQQLAGRSSSSLPLPVTYNSDPMEINAISTSSAQQKQVVRRRDLANMPVYQAFPYKDDDDE